jgi:hypothetical protein
MEIIPAQHRSDFLTCVAMELRDAAHFLQVSRQELAVDNTQMSGCGDAINMIPPTPTSQPSIEPGGLCSTHTPALGTRETAGRDATAPRLLRCYPTPATSSESQLKLLRPAALTTSIASHCPPPLVACQPLQAHHLSASPQGGTQSHSMATAVVSHKPWQQHAEQPDILSKAQQQRAAQSRLQAMPPDVLLQQLQEASARITQMQRDLSVLLQSRKCSDVSVGYCHGALPAQVHRSLVLKKHCMGSVAEKHLGVSKSVALERLRNLQ